MLNLKVNAILINKRSSEFVVKSITEELVTLECVKPYKGSGDSKGMSASIKPDKLESVYSLKAEKAEKVNKVNDDGEPIAEFTERAKKLFDSRNLEITEKGRRVRFPLNVAVVCRRSKGVALYLHEEDTTAESLAKYFDIELEKVKDATKDEPGFSFRIYVYREQFGSAVRLISKLYTERRDRKAKAEKEKTVKKEEPAA